MTKKKINKHVSSCSLNNERILVLILCEVLDLLFEVILHCSIASKELNCDGILVTKHSLNCNVNQNNYRD